MANTLRVSIQPNKGATRVVRIAQPSLRVSIASGLVLAPTPARTPAERAADGEIRRVRGYALNGAPDVVTQTAIDLLIMAGWPEWAIDWEYLGEGQSTASTVAVSPSHAISISLQPPSIIAVLSASAQVPSFRANLAFSDVPAYATEAGTTIAVIPSFGVELLFGGVEAQGAQAAVSIVPSFGIVMGMVAVQAQGTIAYAAAVPSFGVNIAMSTPTTEAVIANGPIVSTASVPSCGVNMALGAATASGVSVISAVASGISAGVNLTMAAPAIEGVTANELPSSTVSITFVYESAAASVDSFGISIGLTAPTISGNTGPTSTVSMTLL